MEAADGESSLCSFLGYSVSSAYFRGEVINGGFGLVLDGSDLAFEKATAMLNWDVSNGVARRFGIPLKMTWRLEKLCCFLNSRSWSGNENAKKTIYRAMCDNGKLRVTMPHAVLDDAILETALGASQ